jgi:DNA-binding transcriptional MerR regulator
MNRKGHKREKIIELLVSKPDMTIKEISELCGVTKNYANVIIQGYKAAKSNESSFEQSLPFEEGFDAHLYKKVTKLNEEIVELQQDILGYRAVISYLEHKLEHSVADAV